MSDKAGTIMKSTWFSPYSHIQYIVYYDGSEFKLPFETVFDSDGLKHKPTSVRNPQANTMLKRVHQTIMVMLHTAELNMAGTVSKSDKANFLTMPHGPFALPITQY